MEAVYTFKNHKSLALIEKKINESSNTLEDSISIKCLEEEIEFSYNIEQGLLLCNKDESKAIKKNNVLGEFLSLKDYDLADLKKFIEKYGYFFKISNSNHYTRLEAKQIYILKSRLEAIIHLMYASSGESEVDYAKVIHAIYVLLFTAQLSSDNDRKVKQLSIINLLYNFPKYEEFSGSSDIVISKTDAEGRESSYYQIEDYSLEEGLFELAIQEYHNFIAGSDNSIVLSKNLLKAFKNKHLIKKQQDKWIVDFLFHMWVDFEVLYVDSVSLDELLNAKIYENFNDKAGKKMKELSLNIARYLISKEINQALGRISPSYDFNRLKPAWKIPDLYSALYFAIFNINSCEAVIRQCENDKCKDYFIVNKSNTKKKYCCDHCAKAASQRKYSAKIKAMS